MRLTLNDKSKIDILVALFQLFKNCSVVIKLEFSSNNLIIQGMDKSHICLFITTIKSDWFTIYSFVENVSFIIDSATILSILTRIQENQLLVMEYNIQNETLDLEVLSNINSKNETKNENKKETKDKKEEKVEYNRYFQIQLIDLELENYTIPEVNYDAEFSINSKQLNELMSQLILFGDTLNIVCNEDEIYLETTGDCGKMKVDIPIDSLNEFSISEGEKMEISFSLQNLFKMTMSTKLSKDIEIGIRNDYPIRIKYDLGEESSSVFFIAPKVIN
jgi:proliferating cell nuclear antigen PCNA